MINIKDTNHLKGVLEKLKPEAKPLWGKMSPQHIVEHLAMVLKISSGKEEVKLYNTQELADKIKATVIHTDVPLQQGIKNPILGDEPPELRNNGFEKALDELFDEIQYFESYYESNPDATHTQPRMGKLNHDEWLVLHNKHFLHHFKQYDLL